MISNILQRIKRGVQNPQEIPPFIKYRIYNNNCSSFFEYKIKREHGDAPIFQAANFDEPGNCTRDYQYINFLSDYGLSELSRHQYMNLETYCSLPKLAQSIGCDSIIEIGAGLSTGIWSEYAKRNEATVTSIDMNFENVRQYYSYDGYMKIREHVDFRRGMSISPELLLEFYNSSTKRLGDVPVSKFESKIDLFCRLRGCNRSKFDTVLELSNQTLSMSEVIVSNQSLYFPAEYISCYIGQANLNNHVNTLAKNERTGILDNLIASNDAWDLVWLDSGELSSIVEWSKLNEHITKGGLVALHDIFAPKSMKNFVVAASILASPDWKPLCIDSRTKQGLMIAQKCI
jgi:predicted O-methyltransferase YrrM